MSSVTLWHCDCLILRYVYGCLFHLLEKIQHIILLGRFFAWPAGHLHLAALNSYLPTLANCLLRPQRKEIRTFKNKKNFQVQQKLLIIKVKKMSKIYAWNAVFPPLSVQWSQLMVFRHSIVSPVSIQFATDKDNQEVRYWPNFFTK